MDWEIKEEADGHYGIYVGDKNIITVWNDGDSKAQIIANEICGYHNGEYYG